MFIAITYIQYFVLAYVYIVFSLENTFYNIYGDILIRTFYHKPQHLAADRFIGYLTLKRPVPVKKTKPSFVGY